MKIRSDISLLLSFLFVILTKPSLAQSVPGYTITRYTDENGLPQNSVNAIAQDSKGFWWLATEAGLVRFDGQSFFTFDKTILNIPGNRIRLFLPNSGKSKEDPLFYSFDGVGSYIGVYRDSYARTTGNRHGDEIRASINKNLKNGSAHYLVSLPVVFSAFDIDTLESPDLGVLLLDSNAYYLRDNGNIEYRIGGKRQFRTYFPQNSNLLVHHNSLYSALENGELFRIDKSGGHPVTIKGDILNDTRYVKNNHKISYFWNNISQQTFIHLEGSLYSVKYSGLNEVHTTLLMTGMNLEDHGVISICVDDSGNILLGSRTEGFYFFRPKRFHVITVPKDSVGSVFYAIAPLGANSVITRQGYKINLDSTGPFPKQEKEKLGHYWLWNFLAKDQKGNLWVSESISPISRRLSKYNQNGEKLLASWVMPRAVDGVYCDMLGTTWFQTDLGAIYHISSKGTSGTAPSLLKNINVKGINVFHRSGTKQLWIGTATGMYAIDIGTATITPIKGLAGKNIRAILGIGAELWICTYGDGIYLYKDKKLAHLPVDEDKYLLSSHCIVPDEKGRFWISTNKGLFIASRADLLNYSAGKVSSVFYYYYDKSSGFNTNEFNGGCQPCGIRLQSGNIALPSFNGIVYFNPSEFNISFPNKPLLIKQILVDGKSLEPRKTIFVNRDFEQIQVFVSSPYLGSKKNIQISYNITNDHGRASWTTIADAERIYLTGLLPGRHKLNIRKFNGFGNANFYATSVDIIVPPYWYESRWFYAFLILATVITAFVFFKARTAFLKEMSYNQNLLNNAKLYGDIITSINHDVQTPLHYVIYSLEQITKHLDSNVQSDAIFSRMGTEALDSLRRISTLTNNLLHYLKINLYQHQHSIAITSVELHPLVDEIIKMFSAKISRDKISVSNLVREGDEYLINPQIFSVILHNLIDNAVKVSKNGSIHVSVENISEKRYLLIEDSGNGMPVAIAEWLVGLREQIKTSKPGEVLHSSGLGLIIVKDLCRLSDINLTVNLKPGGGTQIFIRLKS